MLPPPCIICKIASDRLRLFAGVVGALIASASMAASSISVDSVVQRWPWNNKIDITYTVTGGQDVVAGVYARIVFTANIGGATYTIDGVRDVGANASNGTHRVTWTLPSGLRANGCEMTATLLTSDTPSGDDYMIVDLDSGEVMYEGLLATQEASNTRYNTDLYKSTNGTSACRMVLRKIPAGGPYPTGSDPSPPSCVNTRHTWTTSRDYYIGVFPVTQYQYAKICGTNTSLKVSVLAGNPVGQRPVENLSWNDLRLATTEPDSPVPTVVDNSGTFLQRLNYLTGNKFGFDLPSEVMSEIAIRAGATTKYYWGDFPKTDYAVSTETSPNSTMAVGSRLPNAWGLYDAQGNVFEWCLDGGNVNTDMAGNADVFTPIAGTDNREVRGGGQFGEGIANTTFLASRRIAIAETTRNDHVGFRVACIVK